MDAELLVARPIRYAQDEMAYPVPVSVLPGLLLSELDVVDFIRSQSCDPATVPDPLYIVYASDPAADCEPLCFHRGTGEIVLLDDITADDFRARVEARPVPWRYQEAAFLALEIVANAVKVQEEDE